MTPDDQGLQANSLLESVQAEVEKARMNDSFDQVRLHVGEESETGLSDQAIKGVLWDTFFNIEETTRWALGSWLPAGQHT